MIIENGLSQKPERLRLIERLGKRNPIDRILKRADDKPAPLSYSQERLWVMSQLEPNNPIYNVAGAVRFDGDVNVFVLEQALTEVVHRHQILRSRFITIDSQPLQQVTPDAELPLESLNLSAFPENEKISAFDRYAALFICRPFQLDKQPPLRVLLTEMNNQQHILLLTLHHIVSDRWSVGVLIQEVAALYEAFCSNLPSPLPTLAIQYADFCVWQRSQQTKWENQLAYWQQKLMGVPPLLELPTDRPRPRLPSYRGDMCRFELPTELSQKLKQLAQQHNVTLFMVMAAAYSTLLYRYSGSRDFCIGYPVAGRNRSQLADLIGFFVNTLVLRCQIDGEMRFIDWLMHLREQALHDLNHQDLAFSQVLEALNLPRNTSHTPLFQVMLTMQNAPTSTLTLAGINTTAIPINSHVAQYDLALLLEEAEGKIQGIVEYSTDLFDSTTISRMVESFQVLLSDIVDKSSASLNRLKILNDIEQKQLVSEWSGRDVDYQEELFIHQLVNEQALQHPDKVALICANQTLSYRELNRRAEYWALALSQQGIKPGSRVGVSLERSAEWIIALFAVLKSGAAYVPLDPDYPDDRLAFMLNDARVDLLITHSGLASKFRRSEFIMLFVDHEPDDIITSEFNLSSNNSHSLSPQHTAYIIYTSGSTGLPKGVAVSHSNLLHSTQVRSRYYRQSLHSFLLLSSFAFDSSVAGIFWTLTQGGCLHLPQRHQLTNLRALVGLIKHYEISHLLGLPSFYASIVESANVHDLASLSTVIVAGEPCSGEIAATHRRLLPNTAFYNEYGPTENTVWSSVYQVEDEPPSMLPIGRPIDNVRIYILDALFQSVPLGVAGELCLSGRGLAQCYLNRPDLTAKKFVPNPFVNDGSRLYRTGDLARFRADGKIEFIGRIDQQVKIRGYRVELSEIEERLLNHSSIKEAIVLADGEFQHNKKLVAYLVMPSFYKAIDNETLQIYLKQTLPDYMIPMDYVWLDALPLMPNGKCDRRALLLMEKIEKSPDTIKLPSNWIEESLSDIWKDVLTLETISISDDFLNLGGHSLAAIQVSSRIQQLFNVDVPLEILFEFTTIETLAIAVTKRLEAQLGEDNIDDLLNEFS